ncbi:MAG: hypothetical protein AB7O67_12650 [Vicinamibacterales bacterium]
MTASRFFVPAALLLLLLAAPVRTAAAADDTPPPRLDVCGRFFCDAQTGAVKDYREVSAFALYARWLKGEEAHVRRYAAAMRREGVTALRVMLTLGGPFWDRRGFHVGPDAGERFYQELPRFVDALGHEGLYVRLTLIAAIEPLGATVPDRSDHFTAATAAAAETMVRRVAPLVGGRSHVLFEIANEWNHIGMADSAEAVVRLGRIVAETAPAALLNLTNTSAAIAGQTTWARPPADYVDTHLPRDKGAGGFTWLAASLDLPVIRQELMPVLSGEPINFGSRGVGGTDDHESSPAVACAYGAVSRLARFYTTFHYDDGLWADLPDAPTLDLLRAWQRCLDAVPFDAIAPGTTRCDDLAPCGPWAEEARPLAAARAAAGDRAWPLRIVGRQGPDGYVAVSLREPRAWDGRPYLVDGARVEELARVEQGPWATVIRRIRPALRPH